MHMLRTRPLTLFLISCLFHLPFVFTFEEDGKCVKLGVSKCQDLNYSMTLMPNVRMNVDTMEEGSRRVGEFSPLFKINCYENLQFFICNMFIPVCQPINDLPIAVYPCRHVCEAARRGCEPLMRKYQFPWPEVLRCESLLSIEDDPRALCGRPPPPQPSSAPVTALVKPPRVIPYWMETVSKFPKSFNWIEFLDQENIWKEFARKFELDVAMPRSKRANMICAMNPKLLYIKRDNEYCPQRCEAHTMFTANNKKFATVWISTWSVICFLSTLLTVSTFLIDHKRFKYPERPIIFLSFCYNLYSVGYLIRVFGGYERVVCESSSQGKHVVIEGMAVTTCTLVFFLLYFFGMASALWWVILSLTWFLSAALKWGHEAIEKYSSLFHAISWAIPTVQTIVALVTRKVDADKLSGLCFIGNESSEDLLLFVALPLMVYLLVGTLFLIMGFIALIKIRKVLRKQRNTSKFERLMIRIGIFSVLYSVPASIVVGCCIQEYNRLKLSEKEAGDFVNCLSDHHCADAFKPPVELFYLRYFMLLVVGVTSGVWIWTSKTLNSWKRFYGRSRGNRNKESRELYKQKLLAASRSNPSRRESADGPAHVPSGSSGIIGSSSMMGQHHKLYQSPTAYYFPIVKHPGEYLQACNLSLPKENMEDNAKKNAENKDDITSTQSSKPYSENPDRNSFSFSSLGNNPDTPATEKRYGNSSQT